MNYKLKPQLRATITNDDFVAIQFDSTLLRGAGIPNTALGSNGDYFLDRVTGNIFHKSANAWAIEVNIKGPKGDKGDKGEEGETVSNDIIIANASEDLFQGAIVNIYETNGVKKVRLANATDSTKPAIGFVTTTILQNQDATVYLNGNNNKLSSLVPEQVYFLSVISGHVSIDPPNELGNIIQSVGISVDSSAINFDLGDLIVIS